MEETFLGKKTGERGFTQVLLKSARCHRAEGMTAGQTPRKKR